jgi:hypothetical protein
MMKYQLAGNAEFAIALLIDWRLTPSAVAKASRPIAAHIS